MEDRNQLQCELSALQNERDSAYQENSRLQSSLKVRLQYSLNADILWCGEMLSLSLQG